MSISSSVAQDGSGTQRTDRWRGLRPGGNRLLWLVRRNRVKLIWATLLASALALFVWLIGLLLFSPLRPTLVVLNAAPYTWPMAPNGWSSEDVGKLAVMDGATITLRGKGQPVASRAEFIARLEREVDRSLGEARRLPLIIWVSMHGIVDGSTGRAYLVPAQSSPTNAQTWIDVEDLLMRLNKLRPADDTLLILDCQRMRVNWNIGLTDNGFADTVRQLFDQHDLGKLTIMMAAGADEHAAVSADLRGSVFGHYLRQGLAGAADLHSPSGNRDGWVSVSELHSYVQSHVHQWVVRNRGTGQSPILLTRGDESDPILVRSLNDKAIARLLDEGRNTKNLGPTIATVRLDGLWQQLDQFRQQRLYQHEPLAWRDLEHRLLSLEQMSESGAGYQQASLRLLDDIAQQMRGIEDAIAKARQSRSVWDQSGIITGDPMADPGSAMRMHTAAMTEYFGTPQSSSAKELLRQLEGFQGQPGPEKILAVRKSLVDQPAAQLEGAHFLGMIDRYQFPGIWQRTREISQLVKLQGEARDFAVPRNAAGMPGDERLIGWTQQLMPHIDRSRRSAEDHLFVQGDTPLIDQLETADENLQSAKVAIDKLHRVAQMCDLVMASMPYLAQWLTDPRRPIKPDSGFDANITVNTILLPLVDHAEALSRKLADHPRAGGDLERIIKSIGDIEQFAKVNVQEPFESLFASFNNQNRRLLSAGDTGSADSVGQFESALSMPLIAWDTRRDLRNQWYRLTASLREKHTPTGKSESKDDGPQAPGSAPESYAVRMRRWDRHPLWAILGDRFQADAAANPMDMFLRSIDRDLAGAVNEATLFARRARCGEVASRLRSAAAIWFASPTKDPVAELRSFDLQILLTWHAERSLDDFWGPVGQSQAFFETAAADYLDAAARVELARSQNRSPETEPVEVEQILARLAASQKAARDWINTTAAPALRIDPGDRLKSSIRIVSDETQTGFQSPPGMASVFVGGTDGVRINGPVFAPVGMVTLPTPGFEIGVTVPPAIVGQETELPVLTMFRGHEYLGTISIRDLGGITVEVKPYRYRQSEVSLSSPRDKLSIVFILDCSRSMENPVGAASESDANRTRMDIATSALQDLLFSLGTRPNSRVGIHFFGHRLGWSTDRPVRSVMRPDFTGTIDPQLTPSQDIERVLGLRNFDLPTLQAVIPRVTGVKPWGQSPLYLSVVRALNEFGPEDSDSDRHIVVVTDGANYQFVSPSETGVRATTDQEVIDAWAQLQVPVHILGLGMNRTDDRQAIEDFQRLCVLTGGRFHSLSGSTDLNNALSRWVDPGNYRLENTEREREPVRRAVLGTPIKVLPAPKSTERFLLTYEGRQWVDEPAVVASDAMQPQEDVWLEGGESLQLYVNDQGDAIHAFGYQSDVVAQSDLVTGAQAATDHVVRVHRPQPQGPGDVAFSVSWQRRDQRADATEPKWRVTARPENIWVQVQPLSADGQSAGQTYAFFDANYEPEQPVPRIRMVARDWPASATKARIRVWSSPADASNFQLLPPIVGDTKAPPVSSLFMRVTLSDALESPIDIAPGVTLRMNRPSAVGVDQPQRLRFIIEFNDSEEGVESIKVNLPEVDQQGIDRIIRQFDSEHATAVHTFEYNNPENTIPEYVEVSHRDWELQDAWELKDGHIDVDVSRPGDFLPVLSSQ